MGKSSSADSPKINPKTETLLQRLWRWLIAPSPEIQAADQRRQATLLSTLLLVFMIGGVVIELITIVMSRGSHYTGYRTTIVAILFLSVVYIMSRTKYIRPASILAITIAMLATFIIGWAQPSGILSGLLDYLILPLWLGSLYLSLEELVFLVATEIIGLLVFPVVVPEITFTSILVGPFSFVFVMSVLLIVLTHHRNQLEQDRRAELTEKEERSRRETARAEVLLRVAERLNAQLDLDTLLKAISEEITRALNTPVSMVALFDQKQNAFYLTTATGISSDLLRDMSSFPGTLYDETVKEFGTVFGLPDVQAFPLLPNIDVFKRLNLRSLAFATMKFEQELIGSLTAITIGESRDFSEDELLLLRGLADQAALAIINTRLYKDARRRLEHLQALRAIDVAIATHHDLGQTLKILLDQITEQLKVDAAVFLLLDETKMRLDYAASRGFRTSALRYTSLGLGVGIAGQAAQQRRIISVQNLSTNPQTLVYAQSLAREGFTSYVAAPLISQEQVKGVLEIFHRSDLIPDEEWLSFLEALAGQAAIAIQSTALFENLQRTNAELIKAYDTTIEGWSHALDLRDKETEGHTLRVTEMTLRLARSFGFSENELLYIRWGTLLHDIGKMGVPDKILLKEGPLDAEEWEIMRKHPVHAHEMLQPIGYLRNSLDIPYCHHEKWDGTGYPRGLKEGAIPLVARIFAVVDVWDAVTSDRPYRRAWSHEKALAHIQEEAGKHFDPYIVEVFIELINQKSDEE